MPPEAIAGLRAGPAWPLWLSLVHTWPREIRGLQAMSPALAWDTVTAPVLLLDGAVSGPSLRASTAAVAAALPRATVTVLPGQAHAALATAPDLVAGAILSFADG
jgi:pimeloyl-ACP methyl ester carboxylesterase